jgi:serine protease AprX
VSVKRLEAAGDDGRTIPVVVTLAGPAEEVLTALASASPLLAGLSRTSQWRRALHGFAARLSSPQIEVLGRHPLVRRVEPDRVIRAHGSRAMYWTGITKAHTDFGVSGDLDSTPDIYTADDIVIAGIDTGMDDGHVDLQGKVIGWYDVVNGQESPYDDNGHGTWTASIMAGSGAANTNRRGVAYGAALVGIKVLDSSGSGTMSGVIDGVEWMLENRETYAIRVGNMSLGSEGPSDGRDALSQAVNSAVDAGIIMCVSAGNSGPGTYTVGSPAAAAKAITVGAVYDPSSYGWALAHFSSRGPTADRRTKPDICLPGVDIAGAVAGSYDRYATGSGTSASAPFATGVVGLMLAADLSLTYGDIRTILTAPANVKRFGPAPANVDFGWGIAKPYDAIKTAGSFIGSWSDGIGLAYKTGSLPRTGASKSYRFRVTDPTKPVGVTLIMTNWSPARDIDLYLYNARGRLVASSTGVTRQETICYKASAAGDLILLLYSYSGAGSYWCNISYK